MSTRKEFESLDDYWAILAAERERDAEEERIRAARLAEYEKGKNMTFTLRRYETDERSET